MKISEFVQQLQAFKRQMGDIEVEFVGYLDDASDPVEMELHEVHDDYVGSGLDVETVCQVRLKPISSETTNP